MKLCTIPEPDARTVLEQLAFVMRVVNALDQSDLPPVVIRWEPTRGALSVATKIMEQVFGNAQQAPPIVED